MKQQTVVTHKVILFCKKFDGSLGWITDCYSRDYISALKLFNILKNNKELVRIELRNIETDELLKVNEVL